jgi:predicted enzyme related to lactoylglutathione lyase
MTVAADPTAPHNGRRPGDVSYVSLALPDVARGERFYGDLLGWSFAPGQLGREQSNQVTPQVGLFDGLPGRDSLDQNRPLLRGAVLGYRVAEITESVTRVGELGGTATEVAQRPYGLETECADNQGLPFFLHQLDDDPSDDGTDLANGLRHGDFAYLTLEVPDLGDAERFYGGLFGWTFTPGSGEAGRQIAGVTPMAGLWQGSDSGVVPAYRVDDIAAAVDKVTALGGQATDVEQRPYGLAADLCRDDQGIRFHLLQLG